MIVKYSLLWCGWPWKGPLLLFRLERAVWCQTYGALCLAPNRDARRISFMYFLRPRKVGCTPSEHMNLSGCRRKHLCLQVYTPGKWQLMSATALLTTRRASLKSGLVGWRQLTTTRGWIGMMTTVFTDGSCLYRRANSPISQAKRLGLSDGDDNSFDPTSKSTTDGLVLSAYDNCCLKHSTVPPLIPLMETWWNVADIDLQSSSRFACSRSTKEWPRINRDIFEAQ